MALTFRLNKESALPAYEQVVQHVITSISQGVLLPGTRLMSVRAGADALGIAPNTVAKAYRRLEELGYVETRGRHGTFVAVDEPDPLHDEVRASALLLARSCRRAGLGFNQASAILRRAFR